MVNLAPGGGAQRIQIKLLGSGKILTIERRRMHPQYDRHEAALGILVDKLNTTLRSQIFTALAPPLSLNLAPVLVKVLIYLCLLK